MSRYFLHSFIILQLLALPACITSTKTAGYISKLARLEKLKEGESTKYDVERVLGSPSAKSKFGKDIWYYISSVTEETPFTRPVIKEQTVLAIVFEGEKLIKIQKKQVEGSRDIVFTEEYTPTEGKEMGVLEQLLGNLGRFNPAN